MVIITPIIMNIIINIVIIKSFDLRKSTWYNGEFYEVVY